MSRPYRDRGKRREDDDLPEAGPSTAHSLRYQQSFPPPEQNYPYRFFPVQGSVTESELAFQQSGAGLRHPLPTPAELLLRSSIKRPSKTDAIKSWSQALPTTFASSPGTSAWPPRSSTIPHPPLSYPMPQSDPVASGSTLPDVIDTGHTGRKRPNRGSGYRVRPPLALSRAGSEIPEGGEAGEELSSSNETRKQENRVAERDFVARSEVNLQYSEASRTRSSSDNPNDHIAHLEAEARAQEAKIKAQNLIIFGLQAENELLRKASAVLSRRGSSRATVPSRGGSRTTSTGTGLTGTGSTGQSGMGSSSLATGQMSQPHSMDKNVAGGADPVAALERFLAKRRSKKRERERDADEDMKSSKSKTSVTPRNAE